MAPSNQNGAAPIFLKQLYNAGVINQKVFSLYITDYYKSGQTGSKILFGGYNTTKYGYPNETITWNTLENDLYWTVNLIKVGINQPKSSQNTTLLDIGTKSSYAILDSGTSYVLMPTADRQTLVNYLKSDFGVYF